MAERETLAFQSLARCALPGQGHSPGAPRSTRPGLQSHPWHSGSNRVAAHGVPGRRVTPAACGARSSSDERRIAHFGEDAIRPAGDAGNERRECKESDSASHGCAGYQPLPGAARQESMTQAANVVTRARRKSSGRVITAQSAGIVIALHRWPISASSGRKRPLFRHPPSPIRHRKS
jgi:hypothetical protein